MKTGIKRLSVLALLSPIIAMAQGFEGLFGGVQLGVVQSQEQINHSLHPSLPITSTGPLLNADITTGNPAKITDIVGIGGLSLGYSGLMTPCLLIGLDVRAYLQDIKMDHRLRVSSSTLGALTDVNTNVHLRQQYSFLGKIGWLMTPETQIYGLFGGQLGKFRYHANANAQLTPIGGTVPFNAQVSQSKSILKWGYLLGLGLEHFVTCNGSIALEYNLANYRSLGIPHRLDAPLVSGVPSTGADFYVDNTVRVLTNATMFKYNYYFL